MMDYNLRFAIVMVTYNRLACLKIALEKYEKQTLAPAYIVVVNNASTDGTKEYLDQWCDIKTGAYEKIVLHCTENTGGSGGFSKGVEVAVKLDCDFLFLADDDAYAEPDTLEKLEAAYSSQNPEEIAALCTAILNHDRYEISHRCKVHRGLFCIKFVFMPLQSYNLQQFEIDVLTFVGAAIRKEAALKIGFPCKEYFIYFDDAEYSLRLRKFGKIYCVPQSVMHHDIENDRRASWKDYYDTRNWIDMIHRHFSHRFFLGAIVERYIKRCSILAAWARKRSKAHRKMCYEAIQDAVHGKLGKNDLYKPGIKI